MKQFFILFFGLFMVFSVSANAKMSYTCKVTLDEVDYSNLGPNDPAPVKTVLEIKSAQILIDSQDEKVVVFPNTDLDLTSRMMTYTDVKESSLTKGKKVVEVIFNIGNKGNGPKAIIARGLQKDSYLSTTYIEQLANNEHMHLTLSCKKI